MLLEVFCCCFFFHKTLHWKILLKTFFMWTIFKVFIDLLQYCFCCLSSGFLAMRHVGSQILAPPPDIQPAPPALEGEVLTSGPPGKSPTRLHSSGHQTVTPIFWMLRLLGALKLSSKLKKKKKLLSKLLLKYNKRTKKVHRQQHPI